MRLCSSRCFLISLRHSKGFLWRSPTALITLMGAYRVGRSFGVRDVVVVLGCRSVMGLYMDLFVLPIFIWLLSFVVASCWMIMLHSFGRVVRSAVW